jgi:transposase
MKDAIPRPRAITRAQRALVIQRVIVDGWTSAAGAATLGVPVDVVDAWVADYRRRGMASLRGGSAMGFPARIAPVRSIFREISNGLRRYLRRDRLAPPAPLRRSSDDGRGSGP